MKASAFSIAARFSASVLSIFLSSSSWVMFSTISVEADKSSLPGAANFSKQFFGFSKALSQTKHLLFAGQSRSLPKGSPLLSPTQRPLGNLERPRATQPLAVLHPDAYGEDDEDAAEGQDTRCRNQQQARRP